MARTAADRIRLLDGINVRVTPSRVHVQPSEVVHGLESTLPWSRVRVLIMQIYLRVFTMCAHRTACSRISTASQSIGCTHLFEAQLTIGKSDCHSC